MEACGPASVAAAVAFPKRSHLYSHSHPHLHSRSSERAPLDYRPNHLLEVLQWSQWVLWEV